jgi:hypothetical protein
MFYNYQIINLIHNFIQQNHNKLFPLFNYLNRLLIMNQMVFLIYIIN